MANPARVRLAIESAPMNRTRLTALILCVLVTVVDGMDFVAIGIVAPLMSAKMGLTETQLGVVLGATQIGAAIGAVGLGRAADVYGRKTLLIVSLCLIAMFTLATAMATDFASLLTARFLVGIALTGALPATLAICSELAPVKYRATLLALVVAGFPLGAAIGNIAGGKLALALGWQSIFYAGAAIPLLLALIVSVAMPESPQFLARKDWRGTRVADVMRKLVPAIDPSTLWRPVTRRQMDEETGGGGSFAQLFTNGRTRPTLILWAMLFCSGALSNVTLVWLPTIFDQANLSLDYAVTVGFAVNIGATVGMASAGRLMELIGPRVTVGSSFAVAAVATVALGQFDVIDRSIMAGAVMGFFLGITTSCGYSLATLLYPTSVRSTGAGAAAAALRIGTVVAPLLIPILINRAWPMSSTFVVVAIVPAIAAVIASRFRRPKVNKTLPSIPVST